MFNANITFTLIVLKYNTCKNKFIKYKIKSLSKNKYKFLNKKYFLNFYGFNILLNFHLYYVYFI